MLRMGLSLDQYLRVYDRILLITSAPNNLIKLLTYFHNYFNTFVRRSIAVGPRIEPDRRHFVAILILQFRNRGVGLWAKCWPGFWPWSSICHLRGDGMLVLSFSRRN